MRPWTTGPVELLEHGLSLLRADSDKNRRFAMIAIDNAVELAIKTYLGLPKRASGVAISRKEFAEMSENFGRLLDGLETHCQDKLVGIDLAEVEWYHRLRNQLYHQGNGLTVEREKAVVYAELARLLFSNLFGVEVQLQGGDGREKLGSFLEVWVAVEKNLVAIARQYRSDLTVTGQRMPPPMTAFVGLVNMKVFKPKLARRIDQLRALRNRIVHGEAELSVELTDAVVSELRSVNDELTKVRNGL